MRKRWAFMLGVVAFASGSLAGWSSREEAIGEGFVNDLRHCAAEAKEPSAVFILITPGKATKDCMSKTDLQYLLGVLMLIEQGVVVDRQQPPKEDQDFSNVPHDNHPVGKNLRNRT